MKKIRSLPQLPRVPARKRTGRCFELSGRGQMHDPSWTLIHGHVAFQPGFGEVLIAHAWLEKRGTVYDATLDRAFTAEQYASEYFAIADKRYSYAQAAKQALRTRHWGPWHKCQEILVARLGPSTRARPGIER